MYIYRSQEKNIQRTGRANLGKELRNINTEIFQLGFETISQIDELFAENGYRDSRTDGDGKITTPTKYALALR